MAGRKRPYFSEVQHGPSDVDNNHSDYVEGRREIQQLATLQQMEFVFGIRKVDLRCLRVAVD